MRWRFALRIPATTGPQLDCLAQIADPCIAEFVRVAAQKLPRRRHHTVRTHAGALAQLSLCGSGAKGCPMKSIVLAIVVAALIGYLVMTLLR